MTITSVKSHPDGGTVEVIAYSSSFGDAGVAVTRRVGYRGNVWFEANRCRGDVMMPIARDASEDVVRRAANVEWLAQQATGRELRAQGEQALERALARRAARQAATV